VSFFVFFANAGVANVVTDAAKPIKITRRFIIDPLLFCVFLKYIEARVKFIIFGDE
jgi:hypothetical protein